VPTRLVWQVCSDITHYDNGGKAGAPCRLVYYPMGFRAFQQLKPEIAAGLPTADKAISAAARVGADGTADGDGSDSMSVTSGSGSEAMDVTDANGATLSKVEQMMAAGQILPIRFPDPGKPEGIRTYRKPIMTMKSISFKYEGTEKWILTDVTVAVTLGSRTVLLGANGAGKTTFLKLCARARARPNCPAPRGHHPRRPSRARHPSHACATWQARR